MKFATNILLLVVFVTTSALLAGCGKKDEPPVDTRTTYYTCPMHPQIIQDKPGTCPICNMDLVPVEESEDHEEHGTPQEPGQGDESGGASAITPDASGRPVVRIDPAVAHNIGVRTETVARRPLVAVLRLDGRVVPEEGKVVSVTARVMGYAEVLRAASSGQTVRKGETLLELYSPDVVITQERLLQSLDRGRDESYARTRERLINWDVPESFIQRIEKTGKVERRFPILSPATGVVLRKNVLEGQNVMPGAELYQIADLSTVWVTARVWQSDLAWVRAGSKASIRLRNLPGRVFESTVFFVSPELDPATRTAGVRLRLANTPALDFRPEMFAEVVLRDSSKQSALAVPAQALIRAGGRDVAVISLGNSRFQPREVTTGREAGGWIEILEGVSEGDEIVTSAQFLIDSESNLRAVVERLRASGADAQKGNHAH
jgi:membrane fusion protein, copper/silver efflux system